MINLIDWVRVFLCLVPVIYVSGMKNITGKVACRNIMVFYVDGVLYKNGNSDTWDQPANVNILGDTQLVAVKCTYSRPVGIKMTLSNGFETSAEWKCTNKYHQGWNERGFKDDTWSNAEVVENEWIWTARKKQDETVYCRKVLGDVAVSGMKNITGEVACRNIMVFYVDGVLYKNGNSDTWDQSANITIPGYNQLVAIKCTYTGSVGIRMTLSNGFETSEAWKCNNKYHQGWNEIGFKDDTWPNAEVVKAEWIWTAGNTKDETVYCRNTLVGHAVLSCPKIAGIAVGISASVTAISIFIMLVFFKKKDHSYTCVCLILLPISTVVFTIAVGLATYFMCENYTDDGTLISTDVAVCVFQLILEVIICLVAIKSQKSTEQSEKVV